VERLGIAVDRHDTEQVATGDLEGVAPLPGRHLDRAELGQASDFCLDVVGLDVDVVAGGVVDRLHGDGDVGEAALRAELWPSGEEEVATPKAADQNAALAAASAAGASTTRLDRRLRCPRCSAS
jgi:hypothetical protein